jgi:SAM-dependent methyltransferase
MTAHLYWDEVWRTDAAGAEWTSPDAWVVGTVDILRARDVKHVLDLGCGLGRHSILLAHEGFSTSGLDRSRSAVISARQAARAHGLTVTYAVGDFTALPYADGSFDSVLAVNVVYHADERGLRRTLAEVRRVLRPAGIYQSTMLSKRNKEYGRGIEIAANTFRQPGASDDKVHAHLYSDAADLVRLHDGFALMSAVDTEDTAPGSFHWRCQFELTVSPEVHRSATTFGMVVA